MATTTTTETARGLTYSVVQHALARPDSQFLCCTYVYFLCGILWPEVQSHSDDGPVHAPGPRSACTFAQAYLHCHAFI